MLVVVSLVQLYSQHSRYEQLVSSLVTHSTFRASVKQSMAGGGDSKHQEPAALAAALRDHAKHQISAEAQGLAAQASTTWGRMTVAGLPPSPVRTPLVGLVLLPLTVAQWLCSIPEQRRQARAAAEKLQQAVAEQRAVEAQEEAEHTERAAARRAAVAALKEARQAQERRWMENVEGLATVSGGGSLGGRKQRASAGGARDAGVSCVHGV